MNYQVTERGFGEGISRTSTVINGLKQMILAGDLRPYERLPPEQALADHLGVSRGSLREGVRALVAMGILETRQGDGTYVTSLDTALLLAPVSFLVNLQSAGGLKHIQHVRRVLEIDAAALATVRMSEGEIARTEVLLRNYEASVGSVPAGDHRSFMEVDVEFHRILAKAAGNPVLEALIESLASQTLHGRMARAINDSGALAHSHEQHRDILVAIKRRDPQAAQLLMGAHLLAVEKYFAHQEPEDSTLPPAPIAPASRT